MSVIARPPGLWFIAGGGAGEDRRARCSGVAIPWRRLRDDGDRGTAEELGLDIDPPPPVRAAPRISAATRSRFASFGDAADQLLLVGRKRHRARHSPDETHASRLRVPLIFVPATAG